MNKQIVAMTNGSGKGVEDTLSDDNAFIEKMFGVIDSRIDLLRTIKAAIVVAYNLPYSQQEVLPDIAQPPTPSLRAHSPRAKRKIASRKQSLARGSSKQMFLDVLAKAGKPMQASEIHQKLQQKGWQTSSNNPKSVVSATLRNLLGSGEVIQVSEGWKIAA